MNTAKPTEAHIEMARKICGRESDSEEKEYAAQLIAEHEARAVAAAVTTLTCTNHNDKQRAECPVCLVAALTTERDQLRARAERAESECLEQARLLGMSASREASLLGKISQLERQLEKNNS